MKLNGNIINLSESISIEQLLTIHNYDLKKVALELNGEIVPKATFGSVLLKDSDTVEVVSFVGGG